MFWNRSSHASEEDLSAYLDGELSDVRARSVASHLERCSQCVAALEGLQDLRQLLSQLPAVEAPRSFVLTPELAGVKPAPEPRRRSPFVLAPVAAFTLFVALFAVDLSSGTSRDEASTAGGGQAVMSGPASMESAMESPEYLSSTPQDSAERLPANSTADGSVPEAALMPPPATGGVSSSAEDTTLSNDSTAQRESQDAERAQLTSTGDGGTDWLLIGQVLAAGAFIVSTVWLFGPGLLKRGR